MTPAQPGVQPTEPSLEDCPCRSVDRGAFDLRKHVRISVHGQPDLAVPQCLHHRPRYRGLLDDCPWAPPATLFPVSYRSATLPGLLPGKRKVMITALTTGVVPSQARALRTGIGFFGQLLR